MRRRANQSGRDDCEYLRGKCARNSALVRSRRPQRRLISPYAGCRTCRANNSCRWGNAGRNNEARDDLCRFCDACLQRLDVQTPHMFSSCNIPRREHANLAGIAHPPFATDRNWQCTRGRRPHALGFCVAQKLTQLPAKFRVFSYCNRDEGTRMGCGLTRRHARPRWLPIVLAGFALIVSSVDACRAQCVEFSDRASQLELDTFVKSPSSLLERLRNDKEKLRYRLATYIATNPSVLPSVQTLIAASASTDRSAIGAALRIAEGRCTSTKPDAARKIKDFAKRIGDLNVQAGYSAAGEDNSGVQAQSQGQGPTQPSRGGALLDGEWKTKLANPFKPVPLPN